MATLEDIKWGDTLVALDGLRALEQLLGNQTGVVARPLSPEAVEAHYAAYERRVSEAKERAFVAAGYAFDQLYPDDILLGWETTVFQAGDEVFGVETSTWKEVSAGVYGTPVPDNTVQWGVYRRPKGAL